MKNIKLKRFLAYFIDFFIISLIISLLYDVNFLNPNRDKYEEAVAEYSTLLDDITNTNSTDVLLFDENQKLFYDINRYGISYSITKIVVIILYFTLFPYFFDGQTIGKKLCKIRCVSLKKKGRVPFYKYLLRSIILPVYSSIAFDTALTVALSSGLVFILSSNYLIQVYSYLTIIAAVWGYIDCTAFLVRKDKRPFHDVFLGMDVDFVSND